ncbi:tRNA (guanine(37)-N1)-methyltransferase [Plasmodiophora brassicae]
MGGALRRVQLRMTPTAPVLDRSAFKNTLELVALQVPSRSCQAFLSNKDLRPFILQRAFVRPIEKDPGDTALRLVLLDEQVKQLDDLSGTARAFVESSGAKFVPFQLEVSYEQCTAEQVMKALMPESCVIRSFETIGHIAHVNLRDDQLPYKHVIAQVLLDKHPNLRTVVNKVGQISNEYRVFDMEVIGGDANLDTEVSEHGSRFQFNFGEVYWNSRLQTEHRRLVDAFEEGCVIADMFCGVGPFAVPAARRRSCTVHANDLNPRSVHYLKKNIALNGIDGSIIPYNLDARQFIEESRERQRTGEISMFDHIIMNLPAMALEFLDVFRGAYAPDEKRPRIHVYCFTCAEEADAEDDILRRAESALGSPIVDPTLHCVRKVAPRKDMYCLSFNLPEQAVGTSAERPMKRHCAEMAPCHP